MKLYYPAIFFPYENGFTVEFPDLPGCITQGDSFEEAFEMAQDVACGWILTSIEDNEDLPTPSAFGAVVAPTGGVVNTIPLDIEQYAKQYSSKSVKKTLSIPEWLNTLAEKENINFSQELQRALKSRLGLTTTAIVNDCVTTLKETTITLSNLVPSLSVGFSNSNSNSTTFDNAYSTELFHASNLIYN